MKMLKPLLWIGCTLAGFAVGYLVFHQPKPLAQPAEALPSVQNLPNLNPYVAFRPQVNLNPREMRSIRPQVEEYLNTAKRSYPDLHVSYYFRDLASGQWVGINEKDLFAPASLLKIPVMISVLKEAETNPDLLQVKAQYDSTLMAAIDEDKDEGFPKQHGQWFTVDELLHQMIAYSDNKATLMLMQVIGEQKVNQVTRDLNLNVSSELGMHSNFVSVKNFAGLFRILYNATYLSPAMSDKALNYLKQTHYSGGIRKAIPQQIAFAQKYGTRDEISSDGKYTNFQLHQFGIVYAPQKPFLIGIMTRGATPQVREKIIEDLGKLTYQKVDEFVQKSMPDVILQ